MKAKTIEQRRAALTDGKRLDVVTAAVSHSLWMEIQNAAKAADTSVSAWLMQAAVEKIVNDEIKAAAGRSNRHGA